MRQSIRDCDLECERGSLDGVAGEGESLSRRAKHRLLEAGLARSAPYYRRRLENQGFSIVSNDCWGAAVYEHLGLAYKTPFVGLFLAAPCFVRLLADLRGYLASSLEFVDDSRYAYLERERRRTSDPYPIGLLGGDVELHFVHYPKRGVAREKWERRVERVDYESLFIKLSADKDLCIREHLEIFDAMPYANKLCLTDRPYPGIRSAVRIPGYVSNGATMYPVCLPYVNVVRWLNGGPVRRQRPWPRSRNLEPSRDGPREPRHNDQ